MLPSWLSTRLATTGPSSRSGTEASAVGLALSVALASSLALGPPVPVCSGDALSDAVALGCWSVVDAWLAGGLAGSSLEQPTRALPALVHFRGPSDRWRLHR